MLRAHEGVEERISRPGETLHAPDLLDIEVLYAIRRLERTGALSADAARLAIGDLELLPVIRYSHTVLVPRAWELRENLTPGDAAYVSLAEILAAPLVTSDTALGRATGHRAEIEVVAA